MFSTAVLTSSSTLGQDTTVSLWTEKVGGWACDLTRDNQQYDGRKAAADRVGTRLFDNRCIAFVKTNTDRSIVMVVQFSSPS